MFLHLEHMKDLLLLGGPILKHITVITIIVLKMEKFGFTVQ